MYINFTYDIDMETETEIEIAISESPNQHFTYWETLKAFPLKLGLRQE